MSLVLQGGPGAVSTGAVRWKCGGSRLPRGRETEVGWFLHFKAGPIGPTAAVCRSGTAPEERRAPPVTGPHTAPWGRADGGTLSRDCLPPISEQGPVRGLPQPGFAGDVQPSPVKGTRIQRLPPPGARPACWCGQGCVWDNNTTLCGRPGGRLGAAEAVRPSLPGRWAGGCPAGRASCFRMMELGWAGPAGGRQGPEGRHGPACAPTIFPKSPFSQGSHNVSQ